MENEGIVRLFSSFQYTAVAHILIHTFKETQNICLPRLLTDSFCRPVEGISPPRSIRL